MRFLIFSGPSKIKFNRFAKYEMPIFSSNNIKNKQRLAEPELSPFMD
jgi:hypothetical protein